MMDLAESGRSHGDASKRLSAAAIRTFRKLSATWRLSRDEERSVLGGIELETLTDWLEHPEHARLGIDQLDRISYLLGIYKSLHILFTRDEQADGWLRRSSTAPLFSGRPAIALLTSGHLEDLARVRFYLDAERSPW